MNFHQASSDLNLTLKIKDLFKLNSQEFQMYETKNQYSRLTLF